MPSRRFFSILLISLGLPTAAIAQNQSVWERGKSAVGKTRQKAGKTVSGLQRWKKHLEQWGLDTSYNRSFSVGGRLNTDGWSGAITYGRKNVNGRLALWQLSFSEVKHEKETKQQGSSKAFPELGAGTQYIYGKQNNLYLLQLSYSRQIQLAPAVLNGNVSIGFRYGGGLTLAMLKPYYLKLIYPDNSTNATTAKLQEETYGDDNAERFLNPSLILGRAGWSNGLDRIKYVPGVHMECAIVITPMTKRLITQTIRLGVQATVVTLPTPVLINSTSKSYQICLFAGLDLGKQWLKGKID